MLSKADEMFEKLGYKSKQDDECIWHQKKITEYIFKDILFLKNKKEISVEIGYYDKNKQLLKKESNINTEELQAINKKCKELRWLE